MKKAKLLFILYLIVVWIAVITFVVKARAQQQFSTYIIQPGDTLSNISLTIKPEADWRILSDKIRYYNNIGPELQPGQKIKIPIK